jgi:hypothetical protein
MTFEVHYWKAEPFFRKHEKFIRESWERYYSLEFDMLNTSQEQFKLLKEAKQCFSQKKNIDREAKSALMKWFNRNINHAQEYVIANGSASASQSSQSNETLNTGESKGQITGKPVEKINWRGTETQLVLYVDLLIQEALLKSDRKWKMIEEHFLVQGKPTKSKNLSQSLENTLAGKTKDEETLKKIVSEVKKLED